VKGTYERNGWLSSLSVNNQSTVNFAYDDDGLLINASSTAGTLSLVRDANIGSVSFTTVGNISTTNQYNGFGELKSFTALVNQVPLFDQAITRDDLGRVTHIAEKNGTNSHEQGYTYDNLGRLTGSTTDGVSTTFVYDSNGNRTSVKTGDTSQITATFDAQDRMQSLGSVQLQHSPTGNLEVKTEGTQSLNLTYDPLGNLTNAVLKNGTTTRKIDYVIDGMGRRVARKVGGAFDKSWLYRDDLRPISEVDSAGVFTHFVYAESASGAPDFLIRSGVIYRVVKDHLGSVRLVVNAKSGEVAQSMSFDAFGRVLEDTNPGFQPFGFAGGHYDADTKLVHFGARDYDPQLGRWTAKDPIGFAGGDTNTYVYVGNDPVNYADPSGLVLKHRGLDRAYAEASLYRRASQWLWGAGAKEWRKGNYGKSALNYGASVATAAFSILGDPGVQALGFAGVVTPLPSISMGMDQFGMHIATWSGGGRASFFVKGGGKVALDVIQRGGAPAGQAGAMFAKALQSAGISRPTEIFVSNVLQKPGQSDAVITSVLERTAQSLGGTISSISQGVDALEKHWIHAVIVY
jgi:RHS repeat-associated protein